MATNPFEHALGEITSIGFVDGITILGGGGIIAHLIKGDINFFF